MGCCSGGIGGGGVITQHVRGRTQQEMLEELRQKNQPIVTEDGFIVKIITDGNKDIPKQPEQPTKDKRD